MTDLPQSALCPFGELLDKRILGEFTPDDRARLDAHLKEGCPSCSERWKAEESLEGLIQGAMEPIVHDVEKRRAPVLSKLNERLAREEDYRRERRRRRIGMNAVLFLIMILGVTLLSVEYFAYAAMRRKLLRAQRVVAETELGAIRLALLKLALERGHDAVPKDRAGLLVALSQKRTDTDRVYYSIDSSRIDPSNGLLLDPWGHPYVYRLVGDQLRIHSTGPNGVDEEGAGDDVGGITAILPR
jgi:hypothetical protein